MGLAEEYEKRFKTPVIKALVTKYLDDESPSVNAIGDIYETEVTNFDASFGFDQGCATCTLVINSPFDEDANYVCFEPMNRVEIKVGWNKLSTLRTVFFGFVDSVELTNPPKTQRLECRDILKLAQDNYLIHSNRKVYAASGVLDELDDNGDPMGGQDPEDRTPQAIITELLTESGIPESRLHLDFVDYPGSGSIVIGNNSTAIFVYESAFDACIRICDLLGYRLWADPVGHVQCREVRTIASSTYCQSYQSQVEEYDDDIEGFVITQSGTLLSVDTSTSDDLRNWVEVYGYEDRKATAAGDSDYVPDPPKYRRTEIRSYLLDTNELVDAVAIRVLEDLNRLRYTGRAQLEGDPRLEIGQTVMIQDIYTTGSGGMNYFLFDYSFSFTPANFVVDLGLVGGVGEGSAPVSNLGPHALFTYRLEREYLEGIIMMDVFVDGSTSYDPDGPFEDLSFTWTCPGFPTAYGVTNVYLVSGMGSLVVTLTIQDSGSPPLSDAITQTISLETGEEQMQQKVIYIASGDYVYSSDDGGGTWLQQTLYGS